MNKKKLKNKLKIEISKRNLKNNLNFSLYSKILADKDKLGRYFSKLEMMHVTKFDLPEQASVKFPLYLSKYEGSNSFKEKSLILLKKDNFICLDSFKHVKSLLDNKQTFSQMMFKLRCLKLLLLLKTK